jgi:hypothetical protein
MTGFGRKVGYIRKVLNEALLAKGLRGAKKASCIVKNTFTKRMH